MKNPLYLLSILAAAAVIGGCAKQELAGEVTELRPAQVTKLTPEELRILPSLTSRRHTISEFDAALKAESIIEFMAGSLRSKSNASRTISELRAVTLFDAPNVQSKAYAADQAVAMPDTLMYIINFADSAGYVMMAADNRVPEQILTFSDNGYIGDTIDNPGMALFMSYAEDYIINSIAKAEAERDSITAVIKAKLDALLAEETTTKGIPPIDPGWEVEGDIRTYEEATQWRISRMVSPLSPVEWNQEWPYNEYVKFKNCTTGKAPTGCVATALSQLIAYWKHPVNHGGYTFNWNNLNSYTGSFSYDNPYKYKTWTQSMSMAPAAIRDQVARLMEVIGNEVVMVYNCPPINSYAPLSNAINFLKRLGYNYNSPSILNPSLGYNHDYTKITQSLDQQKPVLAEGYDSQNAGHCWLIDGYLIKSQTVTVIKVITDQRTGLSKSSVIDIYDRHLNFVHNNWGWGGLHNGYFASNCFDPKYGKAMESNTKSTQGGDENYRYNNKIYPFIYR